MRLLNSVLDVSALSGTDREEMYRLMDRHYANMRRDRFEADLEAKQCAIVVRCPRSLRLVGFSTQVILQTEHQGAEVYALYSGDTVMDRDYWGDPSLAHAWGNLATALIDRYPAGRLYWYLTSKGFRTYRYLPLYFHTYFPRPDVDTPSWAQSLIGAFGKQIGKALYDPGRQVICACAEKDSVRPGIAEPGMRVHTDRHVQFFVERNPGFARGDELCCLAPLARENFTRVAYRVIGMQHRTLSTA